MSYFEDLEYGFWQYLLAGSLAPVIGRSVGSFDILFRALFYMRPIYLLFQDLVESIVNICFFSEQLNNGLSKSKST